MTAPRLMAVTPAGRSLRAPCFILSLRSSLVGFCGNPRGKGRCDLRSGDKAIAPSIARRAHEQHPARAERVLVEQLGPALEGLVGSDHRAIKGCTCGADPFAAFDGRERSLRLEALADSLGRKDQHVAGQLDGDRREAGANGSVGKGLVPDLVVQIVVEMLRIVLSAYESHLGLSRSARDSRPT